MVGERRRLGRRRVLARRVRRLALPVVLAAVVVVLVVSALARIAPASGPYRRTVDRGYGALAGPLVTTSNASGAALRSFLADAASLDRVTFFAQLDALAADTAELRRQYDAITPPDPATAAAAHCAAAMSGRAAASAELRVALQGVLGGPSGLGPVDPTAAADAVVSAGSTLRAADAAWAACRHGLRLAPGSAHLAASVWVPDPSDFAVGAAARLVSAVDGARTLAAVHRLAVLAVVTEPSAVASGPTGVVEPTTQLVVQAIVADQGNVAEDGVEVGGVAQLQGAPASPAPVQRIVDLAAGASTAVTLPGFTVQPGSSYALQVTAESPRATGTGPIASGSLQVQVLASTTLTTVVSSPTRAAPGRSITFSATVVSSLSGIGMPAGTVGFEDDGATIPACAAQPLRAATATCTTTYAGASTHSIQAVYAGAPRFAGSTSPAITVLVGSG